MIILEHLWLLFFALPDVVKLTIVCGVALIAVLIWNTTPRERIRHGEHGPRVESAHGFHHLHTLAVSTEERFSLKESIIVSLYTETHVQQILLATLLEGSTWGMT